MALMTRKVVPPIFRRCYSMREDIRKFREPDKEKKHMLAACEPYFKKVYNLDSDLCKGAAKEKEFELNGMERILHEELLEEIKKSEFVLFIQYSYTKFQFDRVHKNTLTKLGGKFHALNNKIYRETFRTLNMDHILPLFVSRNALLTGETKNLPACVTALNKIPQYILLAGIVDNHLYRHGQLQSIAKADSIEKSRANLLATLYTPSLDLSLYLQSHSSNEQKTQ